DERPALGLGGLGAEASRLVIGLPRADDVGSESADRLLPPLADLLVEVDHGPAADELRAPGERAAVVAVGRARDDDRLELAAAPAVREPRDREGAAERLEAAEPEAAGLVLDVERGETELSGQPAQLDER